MNEYCWEEIDRVIIRSSNSDYNHRLFYNYDGGFENALDLAKDKTPENGVKAWITKEKELESSMKIYHSQVRRILGDQEIDNSTLEAKLISEKKLLVNGVKVVQSIDTFLPWNSDRPDLVKNLFEVA